MEGDVITFVVLWSVVCSSRAASRSQSNTDKHTSRPLPCLQADGMDFPHATGQPCSWRVTWSWLFHFKLTPNISWIFLSNPEHLIIYGWLFLFASFCAWLSSDSSMSGPWACRSPHHHCSRRSLPSRCRQVGMAQENKSSHRPGNTSQQGTGVTRADPRLVMYEAKRNWTCGKNHMSGWQFINVDSWIFLMGLVWRGGRKLAMMRVWPSCNTPRSKWDSNHWIWSKTRVPHQVEGREFCIHTPHSCKWLGIPGRRIRSSSQKLLNRRFHAPAGPREKSCSCHPWGALMTITTPPSVAGLKVQELHGAISGFNLQLKQGLAICRAWCGRAPIHCCRGWTSRGVALIILGFWASGCPGGL